MVGSRTVSVPSDDYTPVIVTKGNVAVAQGGRSGRQRPIGIPKETVFDRTTVDVVRDFVRIVD